MNVRFGAILGTLLLVSGCSGAGDDGRDRNPMNRPGYVQERPENVGGKHRVRGDTNADVFALVNGVDAVRVRLADLDGDRYDISTPEGSRILPTVKVTDGQIVAGVRDSGAAGPAVMDVVLDSSVRWRVRLGGGAVDEAVDLSGGPGGDVDFSAGTSRASVVLPAGQGTQRVVLGGGAGQLAVRLTGSAPVRVRAGGGAGRVMIDGMTFAGVPAGTAWTPDTWQGAADRYDIDATSGVSSIVVSRA